MVQTGWHGLVLAGFKSGESVAVVCTRPGCVVRLSTLTIALVRSRPGNSFLIQPPHRSAKCNTHKTPGTDERPDRFNLSTDTADHRPIDLGWPHGCVLRCHPWCLSGLRCRSGERTIGCRSEDRMHSNQLQRRRSRRAESAIQDQVHQLKLTNTSHPEERRHG